MDIGVGDWVECVSTEADDLVVGAVYRVSDMGDEGVECPHCDSPLWIDLVEFPKIPDEAFCVCHFRPIYRPKQELIEALKAPPKRVKVRA